ncbi:MAG: FAD:protein FMN transferase [Candidatus Omnitrophica bacterium]|nr:FAD:protein FMN transferase [Candidatus Omnitrophota bacterium]
MIEETRPMMGTFVSIQAPVLAGQDAETIQLATDKAFNEIARVESIFSVFKDDSEVSRINRYKREGEPVQTTEEVFGLIERSAACSKNMEGAFDITVKPLADLWREAGKKKVLPSKEEIGAALDKVGSQYIILDRLNLTITFQKDGMALDFGGVAKGYATDRAINVLKECGVANALVSSGGDTYCLGMKSESEPWRVGIQHPRDKKKVFAALQLKDRAIDTAGDYEKYFILDGRRYPHIIDPRTGRPVDNGVASATVVASDATSADMFATALCVLGNRGLEVADAKGLDALIIMEDKDKFKVGMAGGFKEQYGKAKK